MDTTMIGGKIVKARKEKNMSQAQLAQLLFISPQAVGKWERGASIPDIITFNRLAEILGVDLNYFSESFPTVTDAEVTDTRPGIEASGDDTTNPTYVSERQLLTNFSGSDLVETDLAGVTAHKRRFNGTALLGANFAGADLTGSSFSGSDMRHANFDGTNLTDCTLFANDLTAASFSKTILVRTEFSASGLADAIFTDTQFIDVKLVRTDLRQTIFQNCVFNGTDLKYSDLRGVRLNGNTFIGVKFQKAALNDATFDGATLQNVSFLPSYALTNKYHKAIQTICFDGAMMDKLTYASLKSMNADLSKVTII